MKALLNLPLLACLISAPTLAAEPVDTVPLYSDPLLELDIDESENRYQFERSSLRALKVQDPIEGLNRRIFRFNAQFDRYVYLPVVRTYAWATPRPVRTGVSNIFNNLGEIPNLGNSLLQGKFKRSGQTTARLLFNSIFGLAGIFDVAGKMGLPRQKEDFGQTLGVWGVPPGPYLVLPFLGPSSLRDGTGRTADWVLEDYVNYMHSRDVMNDYQATWGIWAIDLRYQTPFRYGALDSPFEYDQVRYLYTKLREFEVDN